VTDSGLTFSLVLLGSMGALGLLLFVDYLIHRKRPYVPQASEARKESSEPPAPIVTVPKPAPLMRLQPLAFTDVFRKSLSDYQANPILLVPLLVSVIESQLATAIISNYYLSPPLASLDLIVTYVVVFLVLLGRISMTGAVVRRGRTTLGDWRVGLKYFWTVIWLGITFGILEYGPVMGAWLLFSSLKSNYTSAQVIISNYTRAQVIISLATVPVTAFVSSALSICLAAVTLDNKNVRESLRVGWRVISDRWSAFGGLFILNASVSLYSTALHYLIGEKFSAYVVGLVSLVIGPLLLLIAFRIYWGFNHSDTEAARVEVNTAAVISRRRFCPECGTELPPSSKFCPSCGTKQDY